jgi:hypothetical protein
MVRRGGAAQSVGESIGNPFGYAVPMSFGAAAKIQCPVREIRSAGAPALR